jgi:hypothetical protein
MTDSYVCRLPPLRKLQLDTIEAAHAVDQLLCISKMAHRSSIVIKHISAKDSVPGFPPVEILTSVSVHTWPQGHVADIRLTAGA